MPDLLGVDSSQLIPIGPARAAGYTVIAGYIGRGIVTKGYIDAVFASGGIFLPIYEEDGRPGDNDNFPEQIDFDDGARQGRIAAADLARMGYPHLGCAFTDDVSGVSVDVDRIWGLGIASTFAAHRVGYGPTHIVRQLVNEAVFGSTWGEGAWAFSVPYVPGQPPPRTPDQCGLQYPRYVYPGGVTSDYNVFYSTPWLGNGGPIVIKDWFDMADKKDLADVVSDAVKPLVDRVATLEQQVADLEQQVARAGRDSRSHPFKINGDGDFVIFNSTNAAGSPSLVRARVPSGAAFLALTDVGFIDPTKDNYAEEPTSTINVTDPARVAELLKLPEVPWPTAA